MSSGADCRFYEKEPGQWFHDLQDWPYGAWPEYRTYGPFEMFDNAYQHLHRNHQNPGGFSLEPLLGCKHDVVKIRRYDERYPVECLRCGKHLKEKP